MSIVNNHNKFQKDVMDFLKSKEYIGIPSGKSTYDEYIINSDTEKKFIILAMLEFKIEKKRIKISGRRDKRVNVSKSQDEGLTLWGERVIFIIKTKDPKDKYILLKQKAFGVLKKSWNGKAKGFTINFPEKWYEKLKNIKDEFSICNDLKSLIEELIKIFQINEKI